MSGLSASASLSLALAMSLGAQTPSSDLQAESKRRAEFVAYLTRNTPGYREIVTRQRSRLQALHQQVMDRETHGQDVSCSRQILEDVDWLADSTMDFARIADRMNDLELVLAHPDKEAGARQQDPMDGGWGRCHSEWFFKVNATFDHITKPSNRNEKPRFELHLLDRINSPEKLKQYFASIATSDIERTGHDNLRELNESLENLTRMILHARPAYFVWDPQLKDAMMDIISNQLRNPQTGWWGPRYIRDGKVQFVDGLSMTYHMVSSLDGKVPDLGKTMDHLLAVKDLDYPIGWLRKGHYSNHHEMDVVALFGYGWRDMSETQQRAAAVEIRKVVRWCLDESLQPDGSFKIETDGDSLEEETNYGASLLARAGVFDKANRFWTAEEFPEAEKVRERIVGFIRRHLATGGAGGTYYEHALEELSARRQGR